MAAPVLDSSPGAADLAPYAAVLRARRPSGGRPMHSTELIEAIAARLGVRIAFDELGYEADFTIVAENEDDAIITARRRWFYLSSDLEMPTWHVTDVTVARLGGNDRSTQ